MPKYEEVLNKYKETHDLTTLDILHIYQLKLIYKNGINNYRFFKVIGFNRSLKAKKALGIHDEIRPEENLISQIGIYGDKSTIIEFRKTVKIELTTTQSLFIG